MNRIRGNEYEIGISGMQNGSHQFEYHVDGAFFEEFGGGLLRDADLDVVAEVRKAGTDIRLNLKIDGNVTVECDRCLEDLVLPLSADETLAVRFMKGADEDAESDDYILLDPGATEIDLKQLIYDYVVISLPLRKMHSIEDCNKDVIRMLGLENNEENI